MQKISLLPIVFAASTGFANDAAPFQCLQLALDTVMAHHQYTWRSAAHRSDIDETVEISKKRVAAEEGQFEEHFGFKITQNYREGFINVRHISIKYLDDTQDTESTGERCVMLGMVDYGLTESKIHRYRPN